MLKTSHGSCVLWAHAFRSASALTLRFIIGTVSHASICTAGYQKVREQLQGSESSNFWSCFQPERGRPRPSLAQAQADYKQCFSKWCCYRSCLAGKTHTATRNHHTLFKFVSKSICIFYVSHDKHLQRHFCCVRHAAQSFPPGEKMNPIKNAHLSFYLCMEPVRVFSSHRCG